VSTDITVTAQPAKPVIRNQQGLQLATLDDMWRFACAVAKSGLAPKGLETPEAALIALEMGSEIGLPPMAAIQNIAVINRRPSVWGDIMLGLCQQSGLFDNAIFEERLEGAGKAMAATCTVRRLPDGKPIVRSFSMEQAIRAALAAKDIWKSYPERMLQMRARSIALRDAFPDVLKGLRSAEEERDAATMELPTQTDGTRSERFLSRVVAPELEHESTNPDQAIEDAAAEELAAGPSGTTPEVGERPTHPDNAEDAADVLAYYEAELGKCGSTQAVNALVAKLDDLYAWLPAGVQDRVRELAGEVKDIIRSASAA